MALDAASANVTTAPRPGVDGLIALTAGDMEKVNALIRERMDSPVPVIPALADHLIAAGASGFARC